ncbi:MAG: hypothetical protein P9X24_15080 [Candidatus Hatepunaea meridiana]|nr:hypothetical protein [Candidatus Hatepunaea meridiana]
MQKNINFVLIIMLLSLNIRASYAQGDLLNEVEIQAVPDAMTFEEYRDANRRLVSGVIVSSLVPVPGMMHFYAGEKKTGYRLLKGAGLGLLSVIAGIVALSGEEDGWKSSDFETVDISGQRYEKIPVFIYEENDVQNTGYTLKKLDKKRKTSEAGVALLIIGGGIIIGTHFYDWIHGLHMIELKRDKVRFKYGKQLSFSMEPMIMPEKYAAGVSLGVKF